MISAWTKHLSNEEDKQQFRKEVLGSKNVFKRLQTILNEMKDDIELLESDKRIYDLPNWEYRQADMLGYKRCLKQLSILINLDQQETNEPIRST